VRGQGHTKRSNAPARIDLKVVLQPVLSKEASKTQIVPAPTIRFSESIEYRPILAPTSITDIPGLRLAETNASSVLSKNRWTERNSATSPSGNRGRSTPREDGNSPVYRQDFANRWGGSPSEQTARVGFGKRCSWALLDLAQR